MLHVILLAVCVRERGEGRECQTYVQVNRAFRIEYDIICDFQMGIEKTWWGKYCASQ